jgi:glutamyl/glutaminyl-tRNA synthetase
VLSEDKTKLSKRKGALPATAYRDLGYLPEALLNFMSFIGWNPGGEREIYSLEELIPLFELENIHKGGAVFNKEKLAWMNKEYMRLQKEEDQLLAVKKYLHEYDDALIKKLLPTIIDRISAYGELASLESSEFRFFMTQPSVDNESLQKIIWKDKDLGEARMHLEMLKSILETADFSSPETIKAVIMPYAEVSGRGNVLWPLRMTLSGQEKSVDPFTICYVLGKDEAIERITRTITAIDS